MIININIELHTRMGHLDIECVNNLNTTFEFE